jgi:glutamate racemase
MDPRPVGIFDSGVGGLSVLREFRSLAPHENVVYLADTGYFPYGPRPVAEVRKRVFSIVQRLLEADVKLVVIACHTASAAALAELREAFGSVPFVGMVPGVKPAALRSPARNVAILATPGTIDGDLYQQVVDQFGRGVKVRSVPAHGLAEMIEKGTATKAEITDMIRSILATSVDAGADTVVLGCTHYSFIKGELADAFPSVTTIDTAAAVAARALDVLREEDILAPDESAGALDLIVTLNAERFRRRMSSLGLGAQSIQEQEPAF